MRKMILFLLSIIIIFVTACDSSIPTETRPPDNVENSNQEPVQGPRPTPTAENSGSESSNQSEPYPGTPPTLTPYPEGYPAPEIIPTVDPYPADSEESGVWVLFPVGVQCEDAATSKYQKAQEVNASLTAAGITVYDVTTTELMVCTACGCPTSAHYRVQISASDLDKAVSLGWETE